MVEQHIFPVLFVVAGFAMFAQLVLVHIFLLVAGDAIQPQLLLIKIARVASGAFNFFMLAL